MASTLGTKNPLRYRGYVYDTDTQLYYCQSRYYDPATGRFLNADDVTLLGTNGDFASLNLFAYCGNNPVLRQDSGGQWWHLAVGAAVGIVTQYACDVITNLAEGKSFTESLKPSSTLADYGSAALSGALAASGAGLGLSISANAALGGITYLANCGINNEDANIKDFGLATGIGAISGITGGSGANGSKMRGIVNTSRNVLKSATSAKKIAMYSSKIAKVKADLIISTFRTIGAGGVSNALNYGRKYMTGSLA